MAIEEETKEEVNPETLVPEAEAPNPGEEVAGPGPTTEDATADPIADETLEVKDGEDPGIAPLADQTGETDPDPAPTEEVATEPKILSYGEKMVGKSFNPGGDPNVDLIKVRCADVIDMCNKPANLSSAKAKLFETAVTQMIIAQMCAVKFITFKH